MNPQYRTSNQLAEWVNDAPNTEVSAFRYSTIIHGGKPIQTGMPQAPHL